MSAIPMLMYHELAHGARPLCRPDEGYRRYCVGASTFGAHLGWLSSNGFRGLSVSQALDAPGSGREVAITFDDGCETDLLFAAPGLAEAGFGATFFVVSGWVGSTGFLTSTQLRELRALGFEIGAHSRSHAYLSDLSPRALREEIEGSKADLEQYIGEPVDHFSCPGGRWNPAVAAIAREAGFRSVSTSRSGLLTPSSDRFSLPRTAILNGMSSGELARICRGQGVWRRQAQSQVLTAVKRVLGNSLYERARMAALRH